MHIDEIYDDPKMVEKAINSLEWENAKIADVFLGYEDHGILTMAIRFEGDIWSQGLAPRILNQGDALINYVKGWLKIAPIHGAVGKHVRVGKRTGKLVAVRPLIESGPVFWPGDKTDRLYLFDSEGNHA